VGAAGYASWGALAKRTRSSSHIGIYRLAESSRRHRQGRRLDSTRRRVSEIEWVTAVSAECFSSRLSCRFWKHQSSCPLLSSSLAASGLQDALCKAYENSANAPGSVLNGRCENPLRGDHGVVELQLDDKEDKPLRENYRSNPTPTSAHEEPRAHSAATSFIPLVKRRTISKSPTHSLRSIPIYCLSGRSRFQAHAVRDFLHWSPTARM
jgi:hypothetical protein